jgi:glycosyltransferase involved in cell wall biosynthesis
VKRRLLLLIDRLEDGGAERQFCELVRGLARDDRFATTVAILAEQRGVYEWALEGLGVPIVGLGRRRRLRTAALRALLREVDRGRHELIHAWKPLACDYAVLVRRVRRVPIVLSSIRNAADHDWKHWLRTRIHARFADRLVANSRAGLDARFRRPRANAVVIRNGVDLARFEVAPARAAAARAALPFAAGTRLIAMAASFTAKKDHASLVEAFARLARSRADVGLVLAGHGATEADVRAQVAARGLAGRVHFAGFVQDAEALLSCAAISAVLTDSRRHREGISNSLVESMALRVPVVATAGGGTGEVVDHGESGLLVAPRDTAQIEAALARLLDDPGEARRLAENGRRRVVEAFGLDRYLREHVALYEAVLAEGAAPSR